jgi:hypothetical protein
MESSQESYISSQSISEKATFDAKSVGTHNNDNFVVEDKEHPKDDLKQVSSARAEFETILQNLRSEHEREMNELLKFSNKEIINLQTNLEEKKKCIQIELNELDREHDSIKARRCDIESLRKENRSIDIDKFEERADFIQEKEREILTLRQELSDTSDLAAFRKNELMTANIEIMKLKDIENSLLQKLDILRTENEGILKAASLPLHHNEMTEKFDASETEALKNDLEKLKLELLKEKDVHDLETHSLHVELESVKSSNLMLQKNFQMKCDELQQMSAQINTDLSLSDGLTVSIEQSPVDPQLKYEASIDSLTVKQVTFKDRFFGMWPIN